MSFQAQEAVQDHSAISSPIGISVLMATARFANRHGIIDGGRGKSPSLDTIAKLARCSKNTVIKWHNEAADLGELTKIVHGSGRGAWCEYRFNYDCLMVQINGSNDDAEPLTVQSEKLNGSTVEPLAANNGSNDADKRFNSLADKLNRLAETVQKLALTVQSTAINGSKIGINGSTVEPITKDTELVTDITDLGSVPTTSADSSYPPIVHFFMQETGLMASAGDIERDWLPALELWQQIHGEKTQERIRRAVKFARGDNPDEKRYTLKSPKSLMTIMANLQSVQAERKARMVSAK